MSHDPDDRVDRLFGGTAPDLAPPRTRLLWSLVAVALLLDVAGTVSCTSVPGAVVTMAAWRLADEELNRARRAERPAPDLVTLARLRLGTAVLLGVVGVLLVVQAYLLATGFYEARLLRFLGAP